MLTANLALANAFEAGFKTQRVEGQIEHSVRVITAVPRPNYDQLENPKPKLLTEVVIEGVIIPEKETTTSQDSN